MRKQIRHVVSSGRVWRRSGTTALELAFVLPVLMALILGAADLGRCAHYDNIVSNAARVGAEYGATHRRTARNAAEWEARILEAVKGELAHLPGYDSGRAILSVRATTRAAEPLLIEVEVAYPFEMIVDWPGLPAAYDVHSLVAYEEYR